MRLSLLHSAMIIIFLRFLNLACSLNLATATPLFLQVKQNESYIDKAIPPPLQNETKTGEEMKRVLSNPLHGIDGGCPCIDASSMLASVESRSCQSSNGETGVRLSAEGGCVPLSYGSLKCLQHDLIYDPSCSLANATETPIPAYCFRPWCYVDAESCMKDSY